MSCVTKRWWKRYLGYTCRACVCSPPSYFCHTSFCIHCKRSQCYRNLSLPEYIFSASSCCYFYLRGCSSLVASRRYAMPFTAPVRPSSGLNGVVGFYNTIPGSVSELLCTHYQMHWWPIKTATIPLEMSKGWQAKLSHLKKDINYQSVPFGKLHRRVLWWNFPGFRSLMLITNGCWNRSGPGGDI